MGEVFEEFTCFFSRVDSRERIAGAVGVAAEELVGAEVMRIGLELSRVIAQ
jgi:hypothetical protein